MFQRQIVVQARHQGLFEITRQVAEVVEQSGTPRGLCNVFIQHTSASLIIQENADPSARADIELFFERLIEPHTGEFTHTAEGPDDMPSHIKSVLSQTSITIPVLDMQLALGSWQGLYLWEHRLQTSPRRLWISVFG